MVGAVAPGASALAVPVVFDGSEAIVLSLTAIVATPAFDAPCQRAPG